METRTVTFNSKCLKAATRKGSSLYIIFADYSTYIYPEMGEHLEKLEAAESAGRYFNKHLKKFGQTAESLAA